MLEHRNSRLSSCWSNQIPLVRNLNFVLKVLSVTPPTPELDITTGPSLASGREVWEILPSARYLLPSHFISGHVPL